MSAYTVGARALDKCQTVSAYTYRELSASVWKWIGTERAYVGAQIVINRWISIRTDIKINIKMVSQLDTQIAIIVVADRYEEIYRQNHRLLFRRIDRQRGLQIDKVTGRQNCA